MKKNPLFRKLAKIQSGNKLRIQSQTSRKQSHFKLNKQNNCIQKGTGLHQIIINLQRNVKDLKKFQYQVSLAKTRSTHSCINVTNFQQNRKTLKKNKSQKKLNNQKQYPCQRQSVCKSGFQNGSTMISIHSGDIQQIRKAYFSVYGRHNSNIVELYNFYRKNIQKSTRILGSMQISNCPQLQLSLVKQQSNRKCEGMLNNIVVEINELNKQNTICNSIKQKNKQIIQQIFSRGSSDLVNAGQIIKKRPLSGYFKRNSKCQKQEQKKYLQKQKVKQLIEIGQVGKKYSNQKEKQQMKTTLFQNQLFKKSFAQYPNSNCPQTALSQTMQRKSNSNKKKQNSNLKNQPSHEKQKQYSKHSNLKNQASNEKQKQFSQKIFSNKKVSKFNQNQTNKISNQNSFLNERIQQFQIIQTSQTNLRQNGLKKYVNDSPLFVNKQLNFEEKQEVFTEKQQTQQNQKKFSQMQNKKQKKSKYYISPDRVQKKSVINELQDCSISFKESPRIIDLDFIPLDL